MPFEFLDRETPGSATHRSGWPYALSALKRYGDPGRPFLIDDYIERTFLSPRSRLTPLVHSKPWIAIVHHPPDAPEWYEPHRLQRLQGNPNWQASLPNLRLVATLGSNLTSWVKETWRKPCVTLRHPTAEPSRKWSVGRFQANADKQLVQIGSYLRNTQAIYQVATPPAIRKVRLIQTAEWVARAHEKCRERYSHRQEVGVVDERAMLHDVAFDSLLTCNVVFIELIAAVANNTIVECIARNTPVVVNRLAGPVDYLGGDYPLFFNDLCEVEGLLTEERILAAHKHLKNVDKSWIRGKFFAESLAKACNELALA
jgi:hypothetical protein